LQLLRALDEPSLVRLHLLVEVITHQLGVLLLDGIEHGLIALDAIHAICDYILDILWQVACIVLCVQDYFKLLLMELYYVVLLLQDSHKLLIVALSGHNCFPMVDGWSLGRFEGNSLLGLL